MRRDPGPERLGQVDAGPGALDPALAGRRQRRHLRPRRGARAARGAAPRQPRVGGGFVLQEDVVGGESRLRGPVLRHTAARHADADPRDSREGRLPDRPQARRHGAPFARNAAEGRACTRPTHLAGAAPARRADDRARSALEARGAGVHRGDAADARRDDAPLHARPRRGRGARRPRRDPRPRTAALPGAGGRAEGALPRGDARGGVLRRHRA